MNKITSIQSLVALAAAKGIVPGATSESLGTIEVGLLGAVQTNAKGKLFFQVGDYRIAVASGANVMSLTGELLLISGKNATGEWKMFAVK